MNEKLYNILAKLYRCGFPFKGDHLEDELYNYAETYVRVDPERMELHTKHVQRVTEILNNAFQCPEAKKRFGRIKFKSVLESGSVFENLKVLEPDEFDIMLLFEADTVSKNNWKTSDLDKDSGNNRYVKREVVRSRSTEIDSMKEFTKLVWNKNILLDTINPVKFYDKICDFVVEVLEKTTFEYHCYPLELNLGLKEPKFTPNIRRKGPAVTITVKDSVSGNTMSLDLVPTLELSDGQLLVPKETHWRQSFAVREKELMLEIENNNMEMVDVLRIIKAKACNERKTTPLWMVDSFTYKNALFWLYHQKPNTFGLATIFREYLELLEKYFQSGKLPSYFEINCNLLVKFKQEQLQFLARYLRNIRKNNYYAEFIGLNKVEITSLIFNQKSENKNFNNNVNYLKETAENLINNFQNPDEVARIGYEIGVEVLSGDEIALVCKLDAGSYLPVECYAEGNHNFTPYKIINTDTGEYLDCFKLNRMIENEIKIASDPENGIKVSLLGFVFKGNPELDSNLIYQQVGEMNSEHCRISIGPQLNRMLKTMDSIDQGIRSHVLRKLQCEVSKTRLNLDELLISAVLNNADDYHFSHAGCELLMLTRVVGYIAECLELGEMPSPVDKYTNVLLEFYDIKCSLASIFTLKADLFHTLMFVP